MLVFGTPCVESLIGECRRLRLILLTVLVWRSQGCTLPTGIPELFREDLDCHYRLWREHMSSPPATDYHKTSSNPVFRLLNWRLWLDRTSIPYAFGDGFNLAE